ncbi:MAG: hypothetical protein VW270_11165 [Candidatus Poseidoniales archaeon]
MANSLSASLRENWSRDYQDTAEKVNVFSMIANYRLEPILTKGQQAHRPYMSDIVVNTLSSEGAFTRQDISSTDEYLTVDQEKEASFYVKDIDHWQSHYPTREEQAKKAARRLMNHVDGDVLGDYDAATYNLSDGDFGGTTGNGITLTTSNVGQIFTKARQKLGLADNDQDEDKWAVISEEFYTVLQDKLADRESDLGDEMSRNGYVGKYMGFKLYKSNALGSSYSLAYDATTPTATNTVTINGVVFTFQTTIGSTAGNVLAATDGVTSLTNLKNFINDPGTTSATQVALSTANQNLLKGITASISGGATGTLTLKVEGKGSINVSETLTPAADVWTTGLQIQHVLMGQGKPVDVVVQKYPKMFLQDRTGYIGKDVVNYLVYGLKTFADGARRMVDVKILDV